MFDALRARLAAAKTLPERVLPVAAVAIATAVRGAVKKTKRAGAKRRKAARLEAKLAGKRRPRTPKVRTSGISIDAKAEGDRLVLTASNLVQNVARKQAEPAEWMAILGETVRAAMKEG